MLPDRQSDPFCERSVVLSKALQLLGAKFRFDSNSADLMRLVDWAYKDLPRHRLPGNPTELRVSLRLTPTAQELTPNAQRPRPKARGRAEPPPIAMISGSGLLGGATTASNLVIVAPREDAALVALSPEMLRYPYHSRYELLEFAVFTLAARAQHLVSLHAACVGHRGRGLLLIGPTGAGKSTIALHGLMDGLDFLSEDSTFVSPATMLATGISNFIHIRPDSLGWLGRSRETTAIRQSPVIQRRSGVKKFEFDLRRGSFRLAKAPLKIVGVVLLSPDSAGDQPLLSAISWAALLANFADTQAYAASQPPWREFLRNASRLRLFELRRGNHPCEAVQALRSVLENR